MNDEFFKMFGGEAEETTPLPSQAQTKQPGVVQAKASASAMDQVLATYKQAPEQVASGVGAPSYADGSSSLSPINSSPVSMEDRAKLSFGNVQGKIAYLKQKYQDAAPSINPKTGKPDGDILVKSGDLWHRVDAKNLGEADAWTATKKILASFAPLPIRLNLMAMGQEGLSGKNLKELGGDVADATGKSLPALGAGLSTGLSGLTGGAASIPMAGVGGAGGEAIRSSLGRMIGTYSATPEEQVKDIGLEALLNAGGQAVSLGVKPTINLITAAVKKFSDVAAPPVRNLMAEILHKTADIAPENAQRLFDRAPMVMGALDSAAARAGTEGVEATLKSRNIEQAKSLLSGAQKALSSQFDKKETELLAEVPKNFATNLGQTIQGTLGELAEMGVLLPKKYGSSGNLLEYQVGNPAVIADFLKHPEGSGVLSAEAIKALRQFTSLANGYLKQGELRGADAVKGLIGVRRAFDNLYFNLTRANPDIKQVFTPISANFRNNLTNTIKGVSEDVASKYTAMNAFYASRIPVVAKADRVIRNFNAPETFVNQLMSPAGENVLNKSVVETMSELKGSAGKQLADSLKDGLAANDFIRRWPQFHLKGATLAGAVGIGAHSVGAGPLAAVAGIAAAPLTSQRLVGRSAQVAQSILPYAEQFGDFMKSLPPESMRQFVQSPAMFNTAIQTMLQGMGGEEQLKDALVTQAGAK